MKWIIIVFKYLKYTDLSVMWRPSMVTHTRNLSSAKLVYTH